MLTRSDLTRGPNLKIPRKLAKLRDFSPIDVAEAWGLCRYLSNVIKYIARSSRKECALTDLLKAHWYLNRKISRVDRRLRRPFTGLKKLKPSAKLIAKDWGLSSNLRNVLSHIALFQQRVRGFKAAHSLLRGFLFLKEEIKILSEKGGIK